MLYAILAHWMALTEEEYLLTFHEEEYAEYSQQVSRYF